jgi:hypothetical protein
MTWYQSHIIVSSMDSRPPHFQHEPEPQLFLFIFAPQWQHLWDPMRFFQSSE